MRLHIYRPPAPTGTYCSIQDFYSCPYYRESAYAYLPEEDCLLRISNKSAIRLKDIEWFTKDKMCIGYKSLFRYKGDRNKK